MTRQEHLDWCKRRALAYLPGDPRNAFTSMLSDLRKHPETEEHLAIELGMMMKMGGLLESPEETQEFIEGFH